MAFFNPSPILRVLLYAALIFGLFTLGSVLANTGEIGFPLWFWRDACSMTYNPETGESGGITFETSWENGVLDVLLSLGLALLFYRWRFAGRKRK